MIATRINDNCDNIRLTDRDKIYKYGIHRGYKIITFDENERLTMLVELHIAFSPSGTAYACMWIYGDRHYSSGGGSAKGYGYCKASTAAENAINSAGYQLSENIGGLGYSAIQEALIAIAETLTDNPVHAIEMYA